MNNPYQIPELPLQFNFESLAIYKQLTLASRALAELKGVAKTIPNESILLNTLVLQEAKDSSEVENIVTTQDEVYQADSRLTASKYLEEMVASGFVEKIKIGKSNYYINQQLVDLFINQADLYKKHV